jgi:hypothetical protein
MSAGKELSAELVPLLEHRGTVLVEPTATQAGGGVGPMIMAELQSHGIAFVVSDETLVRQLGDARRYNGSNASTRLIITSAAFGAHPPAGFRLVGTVPGLPPREQAELEQVEQRLVHRIRALRGIRYAPAFADLPTAMQARYRAWAAEIARDPSTAITKRRLLAMYADGTFLGRQMIDVRALGAGDVHRYEVLQDLDDRGSAVLIGPISG